MTTDYPKRYTDMVQHLKNAEDQLARAYGCDMDNAIPCGWLTDLDKQIEGIIAQIGAHVQEESA